MDDLATQLFNSDFDDEDENARPISAETELCALLKTAGCQFKTIGWDHYDCSLELFGCPPEYRMTPDQQKLVYDQGFGKAYVNHDEPERWETHYSWYGKNGFEPNPGWRVSYPHKRNDGTSQTWIESKPIGWFRRMLSF